MEYQLPIFDEILAESQKPLSERPLAAAFYFFDYCIVEIKGDTKENFLAEFQGNRIPGTPYLFYGRCRQTPVRIM